MNTPRSKPPKRFTRIRPFTGDNPNVPAGVYRAGIHDPEIQNALGELAADWPHVEERMIDVLGSLLGTNDDVPARQVFRSIVNANIRIKVMRSLLEEAERNQAKSILFDEIIDEFEALNRIRNGFIHGLWRTHDSGTVYISEPSLDDLAFLSPQRPVSLTEMESTIDRMLALMRKISLLDGKETPPA